MRKPKGIHSYEDTVEQLRTFKVHKKQSDDDIIGELIRAWKGEKDVQLLSGNEIQVNKSLERPDWNVQNDFNV